MRYFFYIGGNDSSDTVRIVGEYAAKEGYDLRAVHIPKTVDNDLPITDHCPGYPSAARFVASAFAGANADNMALQGVYIAIIMGRHAGWLTAASAPVSYTHLPADLRRRGRLHGGQLWRPQFPLWHPRTRDGRHPQPVSYTHLDVYKRQFIY